MIISYGGYFASHEEGLGYCSITTDSGTSVDMKARIISQNAEASGIRCGTLWGCSFGKGNCLSIGTVQSRHIRWSKRFKNTMRNKKKAKLVVIGCQLEIGVAA